MARRLTKLTINEVSSVDRGAGEGVKVMLMKRATETANPGDFDMNQQELEALIAKSVADATATAVAAVTKAFDGKIAEQAQQIALLKMSPAHKAYFDSCDEATKKSFEAMDDKGRDEFMSKNPLKKREDPVDQSQLSDVAKRLADTERENADLRKRLDAADLEKSQADFKKRAAALGLDQEGDGELMRKAFAGDKEAQAAFEKRQLETTTALRKQVETGTLFSEFGTRKAANTDTALGQLQAKAADYRKAHPELSTDQAFAKVYEDPSNAELVQLSKRESLGSAAAA